MANHPETLLETAAAVAELGGCATDIQALADGALLSAQRVVSDHRRQVDTYAAWIAAEIARRSRRDLGYAGLAQAAGFLTPEAMIQSVTGSTRAEAVKFIQVGALMAEAEAFTPEPLDGAGGVEGGESVEGAGHGPEDGGPDGATGADDGPSGSTPAGGDVAGVDVPWRSELARAVSTGVVSVDAAEAIRKGLGTLDEVITADELRTAVRRLLADAVRLNADQLFRRARQLRDELDAEGIARREKERYDLRSFTYYRRQDGMVGGRFLLDPENGTFLTAAMDAVLSPRRGGPRFVDRDAKAKAQELLTDPRTTEQIAADTLMQIFHLAANADPKKLFGSRQPCVRVIVSERTLDRGAGFGRIEGHPDPVSLGTVERRLCDTGILAIKFDDDGQCVNVGRDQRLFTERQRAGLAIRDGGCRFPGCDRPASWSEAHHINPWGKDGGRTDIADGILLCRRHHLLVHNNHWQILRDQHGYWLKPPKAIDPAQELIPMPSKSLPLESGRPPGNTTRPPGSASPPPERESASRPPGSTNRPPGSTNRSPERQGGNRPPDSTTQSPGSTNPRPPGSTNPTVEEQPPRELTLTH